MKAFLLHSEPLARLLQDQKHLTIATKLRKNPESLFGELGQEKQLLQ